MKQAWHPKTFSGTLVTTLQRLDCKDEQRLLDAYLRALRKVEAIHRTNAAYDVKTVQYVSDELTAARRRYWTHVRLHKCRKTGLAASARTSG
jgi:hypothetical protein